MSHNRIVALVDDDLAVLASLTFLLELAGYKVAAYSSALAFLDDGGNGAACLIVDQHMPHMTGLELAARLRTEGASIPVCLSPVHHPPPSPRARPTRNRWGFGETAK